MPTNLRFIETTIKMPVMALPVRSTIVKVGANEILISPGSRVPREQYDLSWKTTDIVAPNTFHHGGVPKAASIYKSATLWKCPGLENKRADINWNKTLTVDGWPYGNELLPILVGGMPKINEVVFVHKPSHSLIVTDLFFNMQNIKGFGAWLILNLFKTYNRFALSWFFMRLIKDKTAFKKSMAEIAAHDFDNIIVSHGQNVIGGGKALFMQALKERGLEPG